MLAPRNVITEALAELREIWPSDSHEMASQLYCKRISASVKKHLIPLGIARLHDLRRTFVQSAYQLFNERDAVLVGFASTVLGHKKKLSKRIMTYLMIRTTNSPSLDLIFNLSKRSDLKACEPEPQKNL
jgi:integrase